MITNNMRLAKNIESIEYNKKKDNNMIIRFNEAKRVYIIRKSKRYFFTNLIDEHKGLLL
jgi:TATA-box binding protein (TBP) (component of TFIID and TFIIIB)